jgi:hypothetical protein
VATTVAAGESDSSAHLDGIRSWVEHGMTMAQATAVTAPMLETSQPFRDARRMPIGGSHDTADGQTASTPFHPAPAMSVLVKSSPLNRSVARLAFAQA